MKIVKRIIWGLVILLVVSAIGIIFWGNAVYPPLQPALDALHSDTQVTVTQHDGFITFEPVGAQPAIGFVFVPGGRVDYRAYSPVLHRIAAQGIFVAVVKVRVNLAFFDINAPDRVISKYPTIQHWVAGGHSLGGIAVASYAARHKDVLDGIVFWASYPSDSSLVNSKLKVLSIYGTNDMAGVDVFKQSQTLLPADANFVVIPGGNHTQFGAYGPQAGDKIAAISPQEQWSQVADATVQFLHKLQK